jgi:TolC family type I secretion outer membrane protein
MKYFFIKIKIICSIFSLLLSLIIISYLNAEEVKSGLSLSDAVKKALENNPKIKAASFQAEASEARVIQARSGLLPRIYLNENFSRTNNPMWAFGTRLNQEDITASDFDPDRLNNPDGINNFITSVTIDWTLFDGGQTWIGLKQTKIEREAAILMLERTREEVIGQTATAYFGLLLAKGQLDLIRHILDTAKAHSIMAKSRLENGLTVKSDFLRAQVRVSELEQELFSAEGNLLIGEAALCSVMGIYPCAPFQAATKLEEAAGEENDADKLVETAFANRKDLKQHLFQEMMAEKEIDKSLAGHLPSLHLMGNYEINSESFSETGDNYMLGAVMRLNLFSGERISGKTREARALLKKIRAVNNELKLGINLQVRQAYYQAESSLKRIKAAQASVTEAEENLRIVRKRYENGLLTIVSLMDAESALKQASTSRLKALHDYNVSLVQLKLAAGIINERLE